MSPDSGFDPVDPIARKLGISTGSVAATVKLLADGNTVPFIARYRKEVTGALDEVQIRSIEEERAYLVELEDRRRTVLDSIESQGKLTDDLRRQILGCTTKSTLEDLYLPHKPRRRTRATMARERGLEPLAQRILELPTHGDPGREAGEYVDPEHEVPDVEAALAGARDIVAETVAENARVRGFVRDQMEARGVLVSKVARGKKGERSKFEQYYDHREPLSRIPSHRYLAIRRGEKEGMLRVSVEVESERLLGRMEQLVGYRAGSPYSKDYRLALEDALGRLVLPGVESEVRSGLKATSDHGAVEVFARNLENLLLSGPLGGQSVVGIDPGIRTGCKCASLDATGKLRRHVTIFPGRSGARKELERIVTEDHPRALAVGNGTGGRETEAFARDVLRELGQEDVMVISVNEAGASIYSASDVAREEFPDLDLTIRGAVSIGRRLQDPLAELVKIEPRSIGVGQYQHDVDQKLLERKLDEVVESCVNRVGVEVNTASAPLLSRVAGIGSTLAAKIVAHRDEHGAFADRKAVLGVSGLGPRTFEQAAGFLRVRGSRNPLDESAVHPERYRLVERICKDLDSSVADLVGNERLAAEIDPVRYVSDEVGEPTLRDIIDELGKPGRDPREVFEPPSYRDDVHSLEDLREGMTLEGIVTNVTAFGAFVDVGVHQDGLVHISQLADRFVQDPHDVVQVGQKLPVRVLEVDLERKRIALSAKQSAGS